ncbi:uncharacterized protein LOC136764048 [Amia ocellicauda]|uniref:uncharacterized protein LOC136764048 n=1 Tax=Amia ocellicauda TaxID=2972642 RepID=UPI003464A8E8
MGKKCRKLKVNSSLKGLQEEGEMGDKVVRGGTSTCAGLSRRHPGFISRVASTCSASQTERIAVSVYFLQLQAYENSSMSPRTALAVVALMVCTFAASYADDTVGCVCNVYVDDRQVRKPLVTLLGGEVTNPEGTCLGSSKCRAACHSLVDEYIVTKNVLKEACTSVPQPEGNWVLLAVSVLDGTSCFPEYLNPMDKINECEDGALIASKPW